eukprot:198557-Rhodomonas_salina.1
MQEENLQAEHSFHPQSSSVSSIRICAGCSQTTTQLTSSSSCGLKRRPSVFARSSVPRIRNSLCDNELIPEPPDAPDAPLTGPRQKVRA